MLGLFAYLEFLEVSYFGQLSPDQILLTKQGEYKLFLGFGHQKRLTKYQKSYLSPEARRSVKNRQAQRVGNDEENSESLSELTDRQSEGEGSGDSKRF